MKKYLLFIALCTFLLILPLSLAQFECVSDEDCSFYYGEGYNCANGECTLSTAQGTSTIPTISATATEECLTNFDCPEGYTCDFGECIITEAGSITELETKVEQATKEVIETKTDVSSINTEVKIINQEIKEVKSSLQNLNTQQKSTEQNIKQDISTVSSGLAILQTEVNTDLEDLSAKLEESSNFTKKVMWWVIVVAIFSVITFFIVHYKNFLFKVPHELKEYINAHLKQGFDYEYIKANLIHSGWKEDSVRKAYEKITEQNYQDYLEKQKKPTKTKKITALHKSTKTAPKKELPHHIIHKQKEQNFKKVSLIGGIAVIVLIALFFGLYKGGVLSGQAIYSDFDTLQPLGQNVIERVLQIHQPLKDISQARVCIQVESQAGSLSYLIVKTPDSQTVIPSKITCDHVNIFDFSLKFNSWASFEGLAAKPSCQDIISLHKNKEYYILPSKTVLQGFKLNSRTDYAPYCKLLSNCLSASEISALGISCTSRNSLEP
ncbi:hypothetical protein HOC13_01205 [Candidatus Woesearchaeota archaeon]|nr:hypothetical protein [Candidatus Woesearchaeota archaeon]